MPCDQRQEFPVLRVQQRMQPQLDSLSTIREHSKIDRVGLGEPAAARSRTWRELSTVIGSPVTGSCNIEQQRIQDSHLVTFEHRRASSRVEPLRSGRGEAGLKRNS